MKRSEVQTKLKTINQVLGRIKGNNQAVSLFVDFSETMVSEYERLTSENQSLKDKLNKLIGEQGKPVVRKQSGNSGDNQDVSSEEDRKKGRKKKKRKKGGSKKSKVKPTNTIALSMSPDELPKDAIKDGVKSTLVQDVNFSVENIEFIRQKYYSRIENKYYLTPLPPGYEGEYGPNIKSWTNALYSDGQMTTNKITWLFNTAGVLVSKPTVYSFLSGAASDINVESETIIRSGLLSTSYQHLDDTSAREHGKNRNVNVLGNEYYSAYFTLPNKDRLSIIKMLSLGELKFLINVETFNLMKMMNIPQKYIDELQKYISEKYYMQNSVDEIIEIVFGPKNKKYRKLTIDAMAIAAYQTSPYAIKQLIVDDAPQFKLITATLGLCWIHEGRHYKKLKPVFQKNIDILADFNAKFWNYYRELRDYKENPTVESANMLRANFESLFSQRTGYEILDKQIALTYKKSQELLLVLDYPNIPIHNNPAELMARYQARTRDVHLHTMSAAGTSIKDALATVSGTAKKLSVNLFSRLHEIITKKTDAVSLAELITIRSGGDTKIV